MNFPVGIAAGQEFYISDKTVLTYLGDGEVSLSITEVDVDRTIDKTDESVIKHSVDTNMIFDYTVEYSFIDIKGTR